MKAAPARKRRKTATSPPHEAARTRRQRAPTLSAGLAVFVGQIAVLAFSTVDTVMSARASADDLAALAIGAAAYLSIFVGFMGVVLAVGPIAGQLYGAGRLKESGHEMQQAMWLGLGLSPIGCALLLLPEPFLALAHTQGAVGDKVRAYLRGWPLRYRRRSSSRPIAASSSPSRGRRR